MSVQSGGGDSFSAFCNYCVGFFYFLNDFATYINIAIFSILLIISIVAFFSKELSFWRMLVISAVLGILTLLFIYVFLTINSYVSNYIKISSQKDPSYFDNSFKEIEFHLTSRSPISQNLKEGKELLSLAYVRKKQHQLEKSYE